MLTQGTNVAHIVLLLSMSLKLTDITQWNVGAVVLEQFLLLTKWYLSRVLIWPRCGKYEVEVKFENSMHNYNATLAKSIYW